MPESRGPHGGQAHIQLASSSPSNDPDAAALLARDNDGTVFGGVVDPPAPQPAPLQPASLPPVLRTVVASVRRLLQRVFGLGFWFLRNPLAAAGRPLLQTARTHSPRSLPGPFLRMSASGGGGWEAVPGGHADSSGTAAGGAPEPPAQGQASRPSSPTWGLGQAQDAYPHPHQSIKDRALEFVKEARHVVHDPDEASAEAVGRIMGKDNYAHPHHAEGLAGHEVKEATIKHHPDKGDEIMGYMRQAGHTIRHPGCAAAEAAGRLMSRDNHTHPYQPLRKAPTSPPPPPHPPAGEALVLAMATARSAFYLPYLAPLREVVSHRAGSELQGRRADSL